MGQPSFEASNAIIYLTYGAFLYVFSFLSAMRGTRDLHGARCTFEHGIRCAVLTLAVG